MALIRLIGTYNIILKSAKSQGGSDVTEERSRLLEYGLTQTDLDLINQTIPHIRRSVPLREVAFEVSSGAVRYPAASAARLDPIEALRHK